MTNIIASPPRASPPRQSLGHRRPPARVVAPFAVRTPLLSPPVLNERIGNESVPEAGNAAANRLLQVSRRLQQIVVDPAKGARGGGVGRVFPPANHAQGVAAAAKILNMQATIVMPKDAPLSKRERTKAYWRRGRAL